VEPANGIGTLNVAVQSLVCVPLTQGENDGQVQFTASHVPLFAEGGADDICDSTFDARKAVKTRARRTMIEIKENNIVAPFIYTYYYLLILFI